MVLGRRSRYCARSVAHPNPWRRQFQFREWLLNQAREGGYDVLLPINEASIVAADALREDIESHAHLLMPSATHLLYTLSKVQASGLARRVGLSTPRTVFIREADDPDAWNDDLGSLRFPIIIKVDNYLRRDGVYVKGRTFEASTPEDAAAHLGGFRGGPATVMAQEMVPGYGAGAFLLRSGGRTRLRFAHRRLHKVPYTGGYSSLRVSSRDGDLIEQAERLLAACDYEGVAMVEFRLGRDDGRPYFMEINGRLWGSLALALHAGVDFPRAWLECQLGGAADDSQPEYPAQLRCRDAIPSELYYLASVLKASGDNGATPPSKLGALIEFLTLSLNPRVRSDTLWLSDPAPWIEAVRHTAPDLLGRAARRVKSHLLARKGRSIYKEAHLNHQRNLDRPSYFSRRPSSILILCYGNICRSPFAEHYWNEQVERRGLDGPRATSAGFFWDQGRHAPERFEQIYHGFGLDLTAHRSRLVTRNQLEAADAILVMDQHNHRDLKSAFPDMIEKTHFLGQFGKGDEIEIEDPYVSPLPRVREVFNRIAQSLDRLLDLIQQAPLSNQPND